MTAAPAPVRKENIALLFEEVITAILRLRSNRTSLSDPRAFRTQMESALIAAAKKARESARYSSDDVRKGTMAVVGFLDESVLKMRSPLFEDWVREPVGLKLFGTHLAGEKVFENLEELLARDDSPDLADVLELHYLCLQLGFTGRYSERRSGDLHALMNAVATKIRRIRGASGDLSPAWAPAAGPARVRRDRSVRYWMMAAVASAVLLVALFATFKIVLGGGAADVRTAAVQVKG